MKRFVFRCFGSSLFLLATVLAVHAQTAPQPSPSPIPAPRPSLEREFFKNILRDQKAIWTAPAHLDRADSKWVVPSSIGFMALITTDRITGDQMNKFQAQVTTSRIVSYPGSTFGVAAVAGTFYLLGRKHNDTRARETGLLSAEAAIDSLIVASALKGISQRGRPLIGRERSEFFDGGDSFPSGHSIQAWSVATVIAHEYRDRRLVQVAAYGLASVVSVARFTGGKHYISDVVVGSALGYGIGRYVYRAHHRAGDAGQAPTSNTERLLITPTYNRAAGQYGIALRWSF